MEVEMQVFISWSGQQSKNLARIIRRWILTVVPESRPWTSDVDLDPGKQWQPELSKQLKSSRLGIVCVTPDNVGAPWLLFEAGALARSDSLLPLLFGLTPSQLPPPMGQFQSLVASKKEMLKLALTVGDRCRSRSGRREAVLERFETAWPWLEAELAALEVPTIPSSDEQATSDLSGEPLLSPEGVNEPPNLLIMARRELAAAEETQAGYDSLMKFHNEHSASLPLTDVEEQDSRSRQRCYALRNVIRILEDLEGSGGATAERSC